MEEDNNVVSSQQAMEEHSLQLLPGEEVTFQCAEEGCKLSNYRFFYTSSPDTLCHIPLNNIDSLEIQANILNITCKEGPLYSCSLASVASFRHSQRIPTIVWRHQGNGMVLARCSQPAVSMFCYRNQHDEELVQSILQSCAANPGMDPPRNPESTRLLIIDARAYSVAYCNRVRGGGSEYEDYYPNCEVRFMNLPNIHNVRKSFQGLRQTLFCYSDQSRWLSQLENTNWLMYMSNLLKTVVQVVEAVEDDCRPVLVHCSDGWDRTPQIIALAELCLDPYYRTTAGFQILVEREWVSFGHKFADRCGHPGCCNDVNERCQVFLQFLDCVYQLQAQFPCHFEFNARYLDHQAHQSSPVAAPEEEFEFLSLEDCPNFCLNHQFQCR
ncbi:MTMR4 [Cordylochernes scorpioides]|uniref:MTMR4 n=1 Tax=Cordylochernes scorpioides TaxID=51811 RepID=A0ABY6LP77_9ARAC|nr:MTMR4 [Cordylochernes scorpioides]